MIAHIESKVREALSRIFEPDWYARQNPDVAESDIDSLEHFLKFGLAEGRSPCRHFDGQWYVENNPDLTDRQIVPFIHYLLEGAQRGYATHPNFPNIYFSNLRSIDQSFSDTPIENYQIQELMVAASYLFDEEYYAVSNQDVVAANVDLLEHFLLSGHIENRNPNPYFDLAWYRATYLSSGAVRINPLVHYLIKGVYLGYATHPNQPPKRFPGRRLGKGEPGVHPLGNFIRSKKIIEGTFLFERDWYLHTYTNVAASGGDPLIHYLLHGVGEGCNPNRMFDTSWYLSAYPNVAESGLNPLAHYIIVGATDGYKPHPFFPAAVAAVNHEHSANSVATPLEDFLHRVVRWEPGAFPRFSPYDVRKATLENKYRRERVHRTDHIRFMTAKPNFIVLIAGEDEAAVRATVDSLSQQTYDQLRIMKDRLDLANYRLDDGSNADYLLWLDAGDRLHPDALYELAAALNKNAGLDLIYFDHDTDLGDGRSEPFHKPDWSPDYLETFDYIGPAVCYRANLVAEVMSVMDGRYDLTLRLTEKPIEILHIDRVLLHRPDRSEPTQEREDSDVRALLGRLDRTGRSGSVTPNVLGAGSYDVKVHLPDTPLVSVVIPTAGRIINYEGHDIDLIVTCLQSIRDRSTYKNLEFIIVDNGDFDRGRLRDLHDLDLNFVTYASPEINIARKINLGAERATGSVLLILNDDVEPLSDDWVERMLAHLAKPHVGIVGAKLLYPDETLQHVGMAACDGHLHHVRHRASSNDLGYGFSTCGVRNYIAVTGAVSMTRARDFRALGGYPEELPIDFNDVDYCYKLNNIGLFAVYEPKATLKHYHAVSAQRTHRPQDFEYFTKRWSAVTRDPYYNEQCFRKQPANFDLFYTERLH